MDAASFSLTTAALLVLMFKAGVALLPPGRLRGRRIPRTAAGVALQLVWEGPMDALDQDPSRSGWWCVVTADRRHLRGPHPAPLPPRRAVRHHRRRNDPRNFAGSSGATYFLAASLSAALLLRCADRRGRLLALTAPALGLAMWLIQANGHGLVAVYGFVLGVALSLAVRRLDKPEAGPIISPSERAGLAGHRGGVHQEAN